MLREDSGSGVIGRAVLRHLPVSGVDEVELGYALMPDYWGRGLATEIGSACVAVAREELALTSIVATTDPRHEASQHVLMKLGFRRTPDALIEHERLAFFRLRLKT
jgi:RimJ/RimL family protein N-acetyltransferase